MKPTTTQTTISNLIVIWASINLAYVLFAFWLSVAMNEAPWTTGGIIIATVKIALDIVQLVFAIMLVRYFRTWLYRVSIALVPITIALFWLPLLIG